MRHAGALALLLAAGAAFPASDRAALNLAIGGTRGGPPDLSTMIVKYRKEFLSGVREASRQGSRPNFDTSAREISRAILSRTPFSQVIHRTGSLVGGLLAAEAPPEAAGEGFERASAGPYRFTGVTAAAASGDPGAVARSIARARADFESSHATADAIASRIVFDETNLLWAIWVGAGGDARPARKFDERNGPYDIPGSPH
jgi:hypothetical protein